MLNPLYRYFNRLFTLESMQWCQWPHAIFSSEAWTDANVRRTILQTTLKAAMEPKLLLQATTQALSMQYVLFVGGGLLCTIAGIAFLDPILDHKISILWSRAGSGLITSLLGLGIGGVVLQHAVIGAQHDQHGLGMLVFLLSLGLMFLFLPFIYHWNKFRDIYLCFTGACMTISAAACTLACFVHYHDCPAGLYGALAATAMLSLNVLRIERICNVHIMSPIFAIFHRMLTFVLAKCKMFLHFTVPAASWIRRTAYRLYLGAVYPACSVASRVVQSLYCGGKRVTQELCRRLLLPGWRFLSGAVGRAWGLTKWLSQTFNRHVIIKLKRIILSAVLSTRCGILWVASSAYKYVLAPSAALAKTSANLIWFSIMDITNWLRVNALSPAKKAVSYAAVSAWRGCLAVGNLTNKRLVVPASQLLHAALKALVRITSWVATHTRDDIAVPMLRAVRRIMITTAESLRWLVVQSLLLCNADVSWASVNAVCTYQCCVHLACSLSLWPMAVYATGILVFGSSLLILAGATIISNSNRINLRLRVWGRSHNHSSLALVFNSVAISVCGGCSRVGGLCFISGQFLHWLPLVSLQQITTTISTAARGIRITGGAAWIKIYSAIYHLSGAVTILFKSVLTALWRILKLPADVLYDAVVFLFSSKWSTLAGGITLLAVALKYETFLPYIISAWSHCSECGANGMITLWRYVQTAPPIRIWSAVGCHILAHTPVIKASSLHALQHAIITLNSALDPVKSPMAMFGSPLFLASLEGVILGVHFVADPWADLYNRLPWLGGRTLHQSIIYRDRLTWVTIMRARSKLFIFPIFALRGIFMAFSALNLLVLFVGLSYFSYVILLMNNVVFMYLLLVVFCIFIYFYYIMAELNMLLSEANYDQFLIIDQGQQGQDFESIRRRDQQNNQALGNRIDQEERLQTTSQQKVTAVGNPKLTQKRKIPGRVFNEEGCSICFEETCVDKDVVLDCGHVFHYGCIQVWGSRNDRCPNCRQRTVYGIIFS